MQVGSHFPSATTLFRRQVAFDFYLEDLAALAYPHQFPAFRLTPRRWQDSVPVTGKLACTGFS